MARDLKKKKKPISIPALKKKVQTVFNSWIRERDSDKPCISCGTKEGPWNAGHFFPVKGNDGLRFDENNVHKQCARCNWLSDESLIYYTLNLPNRIGEHYFTGLIDRAKWYKKNPKKWTREELEQLLEKYKK